MNVWCTYTGFAHSQANGPRRFLAALGQTHPVKGLAGGSISAYFRIDVSTSSTGVLVLFEHKHPCSFTEDKAIAVGGKWSRRTLRNVVPGFGENPHQDEAFDDAKGDRRVCPAGEHG